MIRTTRTTRTGRDPSDIRPQDNVAVRRQMREEHAPLADAMERRRDERARATLELARSRRVELKGVVARMHAAGTLAATVRAWRPPA